MANPPTRPTRRTVSRHEQEETRQRLVILISIAAIVLAVLSVLIGILYDRVWLPSRPVAQVGTASLNRGAYNTERRHQIARDILQNIQITRLFGAQVGDQFTQQVLQLNEDVRNISAAPTDDQTVGQWSDRQVILQSASAQGITPADADVTQALVNALTQSFPPPAPPISGTTSLTPTAAVAPTAVAEGPTTKPQIGDAPTAAPTETVAPTETPAPTLTAQQAQGDAEALFDRIFQAYDLEVRRSSLRPTLTREDFVTALRDQFTQAVAAEKVQAQLVPAEGFTASTEPTAIETRQIILKPNVAAGASEADITAAITARQSDIDAIYKELQDGADFATLATERTEDYDNQANGGTIPTFDAEGKTQEGAQIDPAYVEQALALEEGAYSQPFRTSAGWHIVQLVRKTVPTNEEQLATARNEAFVKWLDEKRAALPVTRFPAQSPVPTPEPTGTTEPLPTFPLGGVLTETQQLETQEPATVEPTTSSAPTTTTAPTAPAATAAPQSTTPAGTAAPTATP